MSRATRAASSALETSLSVEPEPSGVRLVGDDEQNGEHEEIDVYIADEEDLSEGSFFGESDRLASNRIYRIYARKSVDDGHGADIVAAHEEKYPKKRTGSSFGYIDFRGGSR